MAKIIGHGAPTSKTFGVLGQEYFDKDSNKVYTCTKVTHKTAYRAGEADAEYEWTVIGNDPFEIKMEPVDLVLNQDVLFQYHPDDQYRWEDICPCDPLVADQEYTVIWDGVEHKCVGIADSGWVYIGNPGLWWPDEYEDDGTPFCFDVEDGYLKCCIHAPGEEVTHNITVSTVNRIINKIDYEFMPEGYPRVKTKVVELVPVDDFTATDIGEFENGVTISAVPIDLKIDTKYIVTINGVDYEGECVDTGDGSAIDIEESGKWIFWAFTDGDIFEVSWNSEFGETINLGLSEVKEFVTPMDPRFVGGGGTVFINQHDFGKFTCNRTYEELLDIYWANELHTILPCTVVNPVDIEYGEPAEFEYIWKIEAKKSNGGMAQTKVETARLLFIFGNYDNQHHIIMTADKCYENAV